MPLLRRGSGMNTIENSTLDLLATPFGFAAGILKLDLYPWQVDTMAALNRRGASVAVKAANGSGKSTRLGAPLAIWNAAVHPGSLTIVTAGVYRQVKEQFFTAIRSFAPLFPDWKFLESEVETHTGSRIYGFSTDDPGRFEGWHNKNLLLICDEAKSIPDYIFQAIERCQPTWLLLISSPGPPEGAFYRAFTKERQFYDTFSVTAMDCPHIAPEWIEKQIEKYGAESSLIRSMIFAEFQSDGEDGSLISLRNLEACLAYPPTEEEGAVQAFCDFAAGGDENVLAIRRGNRVELAAAWRDRDTMSAVGKFARLFEKHGLVPGQIYGDGSGLGKPICDRLREIGWRINPVNNGAKPQEERYYANLGAEIWAKGARLIERREVILPNDDSLIAQLTTRKANLNSRGQIQLETKEQMKRRGCPSPDRADAVLGALFNHRTGRLLLA
jgi:phage terminase large subunit